MQPPSSFKARGGRRVARLVGATCVGMAFLALVATHGGMQLTPDSEGGCWVEGAWAWGGGRRV